MLELYIIMATVCQLYVITLCQVFHDVYHVWCTCRETAMPWLSPGNTTPHCFQMSVSMRRSSADILLSIVLAGHSARSHHTTTRSLCCGVWEWRNLQSCGLVWGISWRVSFWYHTAFVGWVHNILWTSIYTDITATSASRTILDKGMVEKPI